MVDDAKAHASEDATRKEGIETRNQADALVYETEKNLKELGDKLDAALKANIETEVGKLKEALKTEDAAQIKSAMEAVQKVWHEASAKLYEHAQQAAGQPGAGAGPGFDPGSAGGAQGASGEQAEDVVDADFEVVDEK